MKAKLIRDMTPAPDSPPEWVTVREDGTSIILAGLEFEHPQAYYQVLMGNAVAVDDECKARVTKVRTPLQLAAAVVASDKLNNPDEQTDEEDEGDYE